MLGYDCIANRSDLHLRFRKPLNEIIPYGSNHFVDKNEATIPLELAITNENFFYFGTCDWAISSCWHGNFSRIRKMVLE